MTKVLVLHGAGIDMRGRAQVEVFGPLTMDGYDEAIRSWAREIGLDVDIFHSNIEGEVINRLYTACRCGDCPGWTADQQPEDRRGLRLFQLALQKSETDVQIVGASEHA